MAGCLSEGESVASLAMGPQLMMGGPSGLTGDRGSCSADSGVRGLSRIKYNRTKFFVTELSVKGFFYINYMVHLLD